MSPPTEKTRVATIWLDGCSECHMSLLDIDERLAAFAGSIDLVFSPIVDTRTYPQNVDVCFIEGAVASGEGVESKPSGIQRASTAWDPPPA